MRVVVAVGILCSLWAVGQAHAAAAITSDPCQRALASLDHEEALAAQAHRAAGAASAAGLPAGLVQARRVAAVACLGAGAERPLLPQSRATAPTTVPGIHIGPAVGVPTTRAAAAAAAAPVQPRLPQVLSSCDAAGCWTSDGTRLQRVGPVLNGPRGACSVAGTAVSCP